MGENKRIRKKIQGWTQQIELHQAKIVAEKLKPRPDAGKIQHWEGEIRTWQTDINQKMERLKKKR